MIRKHINRTLSPYLPAFANGTLRGWRLLLVVAWLRLDKHSRGMVEGLLHLKRAVELESLPQPSPAAWQGIRSRLEPVQPRPAARIFRAYPMAIGVGILILMTIAVFFWQALPPGIVLQWSLEGEQPATFNVYRAERSPGAADSALEFDLLEQIPANSGSGVYRFTDLSLLPGESYIYRVEALGPEGQTFTSSFVSGNSLQALPGQLAFLLVFALLAIGLSVLAKQPNLLRTNPFRTLLPG